jgi:polar amino acid transport system substrate-binding protein
MKMRVIGSLCLGLAIGLTATVAHAQQVKLGIAAEPYPPFTSPDASGEWQGWEIDFARAVCEQAELDCVVTPVSWDGIIPALNSQKIDMIVGSMSITPERLETIDFSDKYYNTPTVVIGSKELDFDATPEGLADKILGVQVSTIHQVYANKHFAPAGVTIREYQTQDEANNDLAAGRLDATQADSIALEAFLETEAGKACCEVKGEVAADVEVLGPGVGIGLRKGDDELKAKLNAAIKEVRANGTYKTISDKYFNFDPWGN